MAELPVFDHPQHIIQDEHPSGATVRFGRGYTFASKPNGPEEVILHLTFHNGLFFMQNLDEKFTLNDTELPHLNILVLRKFYLSVLQYQPFTYNHPYQGKLTCRFNKPLVMPKVRTSEPGAVGAMMTGVAARPAVRVHQTEAFDLEFITIP